MTKIRPPRHAAAYMRCRGGIDELTPERCGPHLQTVLLARIVTEIDGIDITYRSTLATSAML